MTLQIEVQCDAYGCSNSTELYDTGDDAVENEGWFSNPIFDDSHYCPDCWPKVKHELEEEN